MAGDALTAADMAQVRDLFEAAVDRDGDPAAWTQSQDAPDRVKEEVLSLLEHHSRAGSFLTPPEPGRLADIFLDTPALDPGTTLGAYRIERELGRGGMGCVYLATDTRLGRAVAIKAIAPHLTGSDVERGRLRREARAAAQLSHPGICTVFALEERDGEQFIVSEFVDGQTLRGEIAAGGLPSPDCVAAAARELALALQAAHGHGIVHRDMKPENVMRGRDGHLKILDFGLARIDPRPRMSDAAFDDRTSLHTTQSAVMAGTPAYMSPEQLNGVRADARTDLFQLGVLLYEFACGEHPFSAPTPVSTIGRILASEPTPLAGRRPDLPPSLVAAIECCLRKEPRERFVSATDLLAALDGATGLGRVVTHAGQDLSPAGKATWWSAHQLVAIALYFSGCVMAWTIKEWTHGLTTAAFVALGGIATIAGVFRGHLVFTERMNHSSFPAEWKRASAVLFTADVGMAALLGADALLVSSIRPLLAVFALAIGLGIALARLVLEPATTRAAFPGMIER
jgi:tRNA A-37 threonylcarbamoyl transferase component Bud32